uniref:glycosyltransferase n=1 Tax=Ningiella ruwaisensis TaxID=2364274 RepID=UPI001445E445|nr:glycosyltransferase family 4 protein [Ningiella ruwaisensis]
MSTSQSSKSGEQDATKFRILVVGFVWPELRSTAASQNIVSIMRVLEDAGHELHFASAAQQSERFQLEQSQRDILLRIQCHSIRLNCDSFDEFIKHLQPTIVIFDRFLSEEQFAWRVMKHAPNALRVLDLEDLHFLRQARHQYYKQTGYSANYFPKPSTIFEKANQQLLNSDLCARELASILRCDLNLTLSIDEYNILTTRFNVDERKLALVPFIGASFAGLDIDNMDMDNLNADKLTTDALKKSETYNNQQDFISIGNFKHAPNIEAVRILVQKIWPKIRAKLPNVALHIYGAYLPPKIKALEDIKHGIFMHGYVEDHEALFANAKVMLAPIVFGAGVKGKLRDACFASLPSVVTSMAVEGIRFSHWPGAIADSEAEFVKQAVRVYEDAIEIKSNQALFKDIIQRNFDFTVNQQSLIKALTEACLNNAERRVSDFMQNMTCHQTLAAHQYMSQWINAKNQNKA